MTAGRKTLVFSEQQMAELGRMCDEGRFNSEIAEYFGISHPTVVRLKKLIGKARTKRTSAGKVQNPVNGTAAADVPNSVAAAAKKCVNCRHCTINETGIGGMCSALAYTNGDWRDRKKGTKYGVEANWSCCKFEART